MVASVVGGLVLLVLGALLLYGGDGGQRARTEVRPTLELRSEVTLDRATGTTASGVPSTLEAGTEGVEGRTVTAIPFGLGTDESVADMDVLTVECSVGNLDSCDALAEEAPEATQYQQFGRSCGGRREPEPRSPDCTEDGDLAD